MQLVISNLIGPEQDYTAKGRSIQDNLHLVCEVLEGLKDNTKAALINLNQFKAFHRVDHRFFGNGFGDRQIQTGVPQMDQHVVPQPAGSGAGEWGVFGGICA